MKLIFSSPLSWRLEVSHNTLLKSDCHTPWSCVRCHGCRFTHSQFHSKFHSRRHSLRTTLKYTTLVHMCSSYAWTMKPRPRSEWRLGFNSVLPSVFVCCPSFVNFYSFIFFLKMHCLILTKLVCCISKVLMKSLYRSEYFPLFIDMESRAKYFFGAKAIWSKPVVIMATINVQYNVAHIYCYSTFTNPLD